MKKKRSLDVVVSVRTAKRIPRSPAAMAAKRIIARTCKMSRMKMNNKRKNDTDISRSVKRCCCMRAEAKKPLTAKLPFLPMDVVASILSWLPVKSLVRLRAVCKQWRSLTYDPSFAAMHHDRSLALGKLALISPLNESNVLLYDLGQHGQVRDVSFDAIFEVPIRYRFSNSINGLVCAFRDTSKYIAADHGEGGDHQYLLNPFSRELVKLPMSNRAKWGLVGINVGLGFDNSTGGYKLVRVFSKVGNYECCCLEVLELGGSLSTTGVREWRYVGDAPCRMPSYSPVFVKGALHWMVKAYGNDRNGARAADLLVLAFDLKYERVRLMRPPHKAGILTCRLVESPSGHLSIVRSPILWISWRRGLKREDLKLGPDARKWLGLRFSLVVWSLHDYENDDKWIEEHNIDMFEIAATLCISFRPADVALGLRGHEVLFLIEGETTSTQSICAFDLHAKTFRELCPPTSAWKLNFITAWKLNFITESLVSPRSLAGDATLP